MDCDPAQRGASRKVERPSCEVSETNVGGLASWTTCFDRRETLAAGFVVGEVRSSNIDPRKRLQKGAKKEKRLNGDQLDCEEAILMQVVGYRAANSELIPPVKTPPLCGLGPWCACPRICCPHADQCLLSLHRIVIRWSFQSHQAGVGRRQSKIGRWVM